MKSNKLNIAVDICYERLHRIITGKSTNNEQFEWIKNNDKFEGALDVYRIKYVDISMKNNPNNEYLKQINFDIYKKFNPLLDFGAKNENAYSILASLLDHIGE